MNRILFLAFSFALLLASCNEGNKEPHFSAKRIDINDSIQGNKAIENYITPYRVHVDSSLNSTLCYSPDTYTKKDGHLNTAIGNMMADAVWQQANPIFETQSGKTIDFVLLNHGGIRAIVSKGNITTRTAYEIMPFENEVVVVGLKGSQVNELINYLSQAKKAHPVSKGFKLELDQDYKVVSATINGASIQPERTYYVATNDFLYHGGDNMLFFEENELFVELDYKVRNVLIDYFTKTDTLNISKDDRFTQKTIMP